MRLPTILIALPLALAAPLASASPIAIAPRDSTIHDVSVPADTHDNVNIGLTERGTLIVAPENYPDPAHPEKFQEYINSLPPEILRKIGLHMADDKKVAARNIPNEFLPVPVELSPEEVEKILKELNGDKVVIAARGVQAMPVPTAIADGELTNDITNRDIVDDVVKGIVLSETRKALHSGENSGEEKPPKKDEKRDVPAFVEGETGEEGEEKEQPASEPAVVNDGKPGLLDMIAEKLGLKPRPDRMKPASEKRDICWWTSCDRHGGEP